jgi:hypothetical protein
MITYGGRLQDYQVDNVGNLVQRQDLSGSWGVVILAGPFAQNGGPLLSSTPVASRPFTRPEVLVGINGRVDVTAQTSDGHSVVWATFLAPYGVWISRIAAEVA